MTRKHGLQQRSKQSEPLAQGNQEIILFQKRMSMKFFAVWIMVITTLQWITLDMYLPALPILKEAFGVSEAMMNISLNTGIIATAVGTLISGTLSDRFGRKWLLLAGLATSGVSSFVCVLAKSIVLLSVMRGFGGLGTGFALAILTAMLKDSFTGRMFQRLTTITQSVAVIGPIVAPSLGSLLINWHSWHMIFIFLGATSLISAVPMLFSTETCPSEKRVVGSLRDMLQEAGSLIREKSFVLFLAIMALLTIPVWAYVSISSYVYINDFGLSNLMYGAFYAVGSVLSFLGPILYILLNKAMQTSHVVTFAIILAAIGGVELLTTGKISPVLFLLAVGPLMIAEGVIRPLGLVVLLEEHADKAGTASSLIHFVLNVVGSVGASLATLNWSSQIAGAGGITVCCVVAAVSCWMVIVRRKLLKRRLGF